MGLADVLNRITGFMSTLGLIGIPLMFGTGWNIPLGGLLLLIFAPTIGGLLQLALSRAREYDADLDGATLTGDPEGLASALALLERKQGAVWEGLVLPGSRLPEPSLLRTHPNTADRIARLLALRRDKTATLPISATSEPFRALRSCRRSAIRASTGTASASGIETSMFLDLLHSH